ncbi:MAG TPA: DUF1549 and DUF1553 domain-containing protein [Verrucomicrobiota bacterium]|nr:hypothetical protein [Verrucomicrobiales bacterium]HRI14837.1 DUF1549 and DUF1553 domain-containing protein [Verrucomicrobiota bacterium]
MRLTILCAVLMVLGTGAASSLRGAERAADKPVPPPPPLPLIQSLRLEPPQLTLNDARDARTVLVLGERADGGVIDLTAEAKFQAESDTVAVGDDHFLTGKKTGPASVAVSAAGHSVKLPVNVAGTEDRPVGFVRDLEPILARTGCNQGTCHGSAKGKNGFKLSLRGYDPEYDYQSLIQDLSGRRFNRVNVDESLMLQKPLGDVPHEGRQAIKPGSRYHALLRQWIAEGARNEDPAKARATELTILPAVVEIDLPGRQQQFLVLAKYPDGSTRDVTREAILSSNNEEIALVKDYTLTALRRGEMAVLVRYEGLYAAREVVVMGDRTGFAFSPMPENNALDRLVNAKLAKMKINPSDLCTDAEFLRRVYLDLTGQPPTADATRAFLADTTESRQKRDKVIDSLIGSPAYAEFWANKFADLLQCNSETLGKKGVWVFRNWIETQFAKNRPYDQFVRDLLLAKGSTFENPAGNYLRALRDPGKMTEDVSQTFLGVRFNCNKCHDHPFERWTQNQYYEFGAYFAQVAFKRGTLGRDNLIRGNETYASEQVSEDIVYQNYNGGEVKHPKNDKVVPPQVPYGHAREIPAGQDRREAFAEWLTSKDNPYFAKSTVNRFWSYFFGRGIIDPVDDIRAGNPPSNPELLETLTADFIASGYNVQKLLREICQSRTYQLSIVKNRWNEDDTINFSHANPRRLSAEQMLDAVAVATGHRPQFKDLPVGLRAVEVPDGMVGGNDFLALFGRPKRQSACECERSSNVTLSHALNLINGPTLGESVSNADNRFTKLVAAESDDRKVIEEVYFSCLNRPPTEQELSEIKLGTGDQRLESTQDLAWALLNSPAFLFNR